MEARPVGNLPEGERWRYEVRYYQVTEGRFRHLTTLLHRWPDKVPRQCGFDQLPAAADGALDFLARVLPLGDGLTIARKR
jgi:hypothetical protein